MSVRGHQSVIALYNPVSLTNELKSKEEKNSPQTNFHSADPRLKMEGFKVVEIYYR